MVSKLRSQLPAAKHIGVNKTSRGPKCWSRKQFKRCSRIVGVLKKEKKKTSSGKEDVRFESVLLIASPTSARVTMHRASWSCKV